MKLLVDANELPDGLAVQLDGTIIKDADNMLFAWYGNGKNQVHIPCEVIVAAPDVVTVHGEEELPKGGDE